MPLKTETHAVGRIINRTTAVGGVVSCIHLCNGEDTLGGERKVEVEKVEVDFFLLTFLQPLPDRTHCVPCEIWFRVVPQIPNGKTHIIRTDTVRL